MPSQFVENFYGTSSWLIAWEGQQQPDAVGAPRLLPPCGARARSSGACDKRQERSPPPVRPASRSGTASLLYRDDERLAFLEHIGADELYRLFGRCVAFVV